MICFDSSRFFTAHKKPTLSPFAYFMLQLVSFLLDFRISVWPNRLKKLTSPQTQDRTFRFEITSHDFNEEGETEFSLFGEVKTDKSVLSCAWFLTSSSLAMKRARDESCATDAPTIQRIEVESIQELQRWVSRNWEENGNIIALEKAWTEGQPIKLLKKEVTTGSFPLWKEMEIISLPNEDKKKSFCAIIHDVTHQRNELVSKALD